MKPTVRLNIKPFIKKDLPQTVQPIQTSTQSSSSVSSTATSSLSTTTTQKEKPITTLTPTFLLKGVDPLKVLNDYLSGKRSIYSGIDKASMKTSQMSDKTVKTVVPFSLLPKYGTSSDDEIYVYSDKTNFQKKILTINHQSFIIAKEYIDKGQIINTLPKVGKCLWCRMPIEDAPIGIPISMEWIRNQNTLPDNSDQISRQPDIIVFHVDGTFCCFECCYAGLKQIYVPKNLFKDPVYNNSEHLLKMMYTILYPEKGSGTQELREAPDWRLLKENGGCLEPNEFFSKTNTYIKIPNVVMLPVKMEYIILKS